MDVDERKKKTEIIAWIGLADEDYVAARTLLVNAYLTQGAVLAHSAIEKYLKTVHRIIGLSFGTQGEKAHDLVTLYENLRKSAPFAVLNENYLKLLVRIYKLRYPDRLPENFSVSINQMKTLAGLDETVFKIRRGIKITNTDGTKRKTKFDELLAKKSTPLLQGNHVFGTVSREWIFKEPGYYYEMRVLKDGSWMEIDYTSYATDDGVYDLDGFVPGSTDKQFTLQAEPIQIQLPTDNPSKP